MRAAGGFSLVEVLVALALSIGVAAAVFSAVNPAGSAFAVQTEASDMHQRLRVATAAIGRDLDAAGAGPAIGLHRGPLHREVAAVLPYRLGAGAADGWFRTDALTVVTVPPTAVQTSTSTPMSGRSGLVSVHLDPGCPGGGAPCGLAPRTTVAVFDGTGAMDLFTVVRAVGLEVDLRHHGPDGSHVYPAGSAIAEVIVHTYFLRADAATGVEQLVREDAADGTATPVIDHAVGLAFEYFGDPEPPRMRAGPVEPSGPATTYGLVPPPPGLQTTGFGPGENCTFAGAGTPVPRLPVLAADVGPWVRLEAGRLTDGPWCPDDQHPFRFDADLLRIRRVTARVRVQSALAALRGPAGVLFVRGGTSSGGNRFLPDIEGRVVVGPRNLGLVLAP